MPLTSINDKSIFLSFLSLTIVGYWIQDNRRTAFWQTVILVLTCVNIGVLNTNLKIDLYCVRDDLDESLYVLCTLLTAYFSVFKIIVMIWRRKELFELIAIVQEKFFKSKYDHYEEEIVRKNKRIAFFFVCCFTICAHGTIINYVLYPIITNLGKNDSQRILPFRIWTSWASVSPYFEMLFLQEIVATYQIGLFYFSFDCLLFTINMTVSGQFRILRYRLTTLNKVGDKGSSTKSYAAFKNCIRQHQSLIVYCDKLRKVFSTFALIEILLFSVLICLVGYQILMANAATARRFIFICHIGGSLSQLFMFSYGCDCLIEESEAIASAMYSAPWAQQPMSHSGKMLRKDSVMVIMRSSNPCFLSACGFSSISLETYTKVLSTSVSYFTLLKQRAES